MSRRTFIKQWNPAVPIGGRGRGRRKKGSDPDQAFQSAFRTVHDPAVEPRRQGGRDADAPTRFYSASGLTAAGLPAPDDRFRAHTVGTRGGRGGIQQRVGMFRNAIQSNVIFGGPSEKVLRHSRRKIDRLIAPESDVPESVGEWRRSPQRNNQRRRDVYEYDSEEEEEEERAEEARHKPRRRVSNQKRLPEKRRDPEYDPYEFRDDDSGAEDYPVQPSRPRRSNSRNVTGPSSSREPTAYARERLRSKDERARPRRLFDADEDEEEEEGRRPERRGGERHEPARMDKRNEKRLRDSSPSLHAAPAARHAVARRQSLHRRGEEAAASAAAVSPTLLSRLREQADSDDVPAVDTRSDANYTQSIATSIARRILSGLPPLRLKEDNGSESYLAASRSIISGALDRFMTEEQDESEGGDPPSDERQPGNQGLAIIRTLMDRTQHINVSDESGQEEEENEKEEGRGGGGALEHIFSRHMKGDSPVLERLFSHTIREASIPQVTVNEEEEEEVDTAQMLGLGDQQQPPSVSGGGGNNTTVDPFAIVPRTAGESSGSDSAASLLSHRSMVARSMAEAGRSLALMPPGMEMQGFAAGRDASRSSSDRSERSTARVDKSFHFQMSRSNNITAPPNNFMHNNNEGSFNFEF